MRGSRVFAGSSIASSGVIRWDEGGRKLDVVDAEFAHKLANLR